MEKEANAEPEARYDRYGEAYRDWWAPLIAPGALSLLDRLTPLIPADEPIRILDVGTGTGTLALAALDRWRRATVTAVDPSRLALRLAEEAARLRGEGVADRLHLKWGWADSLPVRDNAVDLVISSFVIQLVPSRIAALREMHRTLRLGGLCAVLTWQAEREPFEPDDIVTLTFDELDLEVPAGGVDPRPYTTPAAAAAELRRAGFRRVSAQVEWLEHRFTPESYVDLAEYWTEDDVFERLDDAARADVRRRLLERLRRLDPTALVWRRPLISVVGQRASAG
jgi:ubiquinone/menaquinone biosynthesis C-methylase UbiE